jgi:hypothetical protein
MLYTRVSNEVSWGEGLRFEVYAYCIHFHIIDYWRFRAILKYTKTLHFVDYGGVQ